MGALVCLNDDGTLSTPNGDAAARRAPNVQTGITYTLQQADENTGVSGNRASAQTYVVPALAVGTSIRVTQIGLGSITVVPGAGVTLNTAYGSTTPARYTSLVLKWTSATEVTVETLATSVPGGSDSRYVHPQPVAADVWVIPHGLGKFPSIIVIDTSGDQCCGDISYDSVNQVTLTFSAPFSGTAYLN